MDDTEQKLDAHIEKLYLPVAKYLCDVKEKHGVEAMAYALFNWQSQAYSQDYTWLYEYIELNYHIKAQNKKLADVVKDKGKVYEL